jgi:uncharacterized membrane protein YgcG
MRLHELGPLPLSIIASLVAAIVLLAVRILVMQRVQQHRQRENRQESERLKSLVNAYRSLAGSFTPAEGEHRAQVEEALAEVVLFGTLKQVEMAAHCAHALIRGETVDFQPLIADLRLDLRIQLGLDPIPSFIDLPSAGPGRNVRPAKGEGGGNGGGGGGGGGGGQGGGGIGGAAGAGGLGAGMIAADSMDGPST